MFQVTDDDEMLIERLRMHPCSGQVTEFTETEHNKIAVDELGKADFRWCVQIRRQTKFQLSARCADVGPAVYALCGFRSDQPVPVPLLEATLADGRQECRQEN